MKKFWWFLIKIALSGAAALLVAGFIYLSWAFAQPLQRDMELFVIQQGRGIGQVARELAAQGIIKEPYSLITWSYLQGTTRKIHAGEYTFEKKMTLADLYQHIVAGKVKRYSLTIVEGWTFQQMLAALHNTPKVQTGLESYEPSGVMRALGHPDEHPEGRFFPDTYTYVAGTVDLDLLKQAYDRMAENLAKVWAQRSENLAIKDPYQALILASIIEKETAVASERGRISGVFQNRLQKGMRLQTDPSVIYGLGKQYNGNLTRSHLRTDQPYNTYTRDGLPPTPIALPGLAALQAAVHPEQTQALYFVAKPDGSHAFSDTLQEHNQALLTIPPGKVWMQKRKIHNDQTRAVYYAGGPGWQRQKHEHQRHCRDPA